MTSIKRTLVVALFALGATVVHDATEVMLPGITMLTKARKPR
jgi:hypothetical protein